MRVFYLVFVISVFLLSGLFKSQPEKLKAPGGKNYSENRRIAYYCMTAVVVAVSGWYSVVQIKKDWKTLKKKMNKHKK
jgi:hypothetical protein